MGQGFVRPTYPIVLPMRDPAGLDAAAVGRFSEAIARGERPATIALGSFVQKAGGDRYARYVLLAVLDGHHKLHAYALRGEPARVLLLTNLDENVIMKDPLHDVEMFFIHFPPRLSAQDLERWQYLDG